MIDRPAAASTRGPVSAPSPVGDSGAGSGRWKWNRLPSPTSLSTRILPPMPTQRSREIARPRPVPPKRRVVDSSAWVKASKIVSSFSGGMPTPVSSTRNASSPACSPGDTARRT